MVLSMSNSKINFDKDDRSSWRRALDFVFGYDFFISYAWSDGATYAAALAARLEDKRFAVFLDRAKYAAGDDWKKVGAWTLRRTGQLILVGSPSAARSDPVLREVEIFGRTRRRIVPIDFGGSTESREFGERFLEYLTPEMIRIREVAGALQSGPSKDTVGNIVNTFDLITQHNKRMRLSVLIVLLLAVLTILSTWFGINARREQIRAEQNLDKAVEVTNGVVDRVVQMSDKYRVPKSVIGDLLDWTHQAFDFLSKHELSDNLRAAQANNLIVFSDYYGKINDSDKQLQVSQQARKILAALVDVSPSNDVWVKRLSMSYDRIGQSYFARGQLTDALTAHKEQLKLDQQLLAKQPEDPERRRDVATSQERIGTVLQFQGNLTDALAAQDAALSISERLAEENRHDPRLQADLAVSHEKKGELLALLDKTEEALASQQNALVIRFQLAQLLPDDTLRQRQLAVSYNKVGQLLVKKSGSFGRQDKPLDQQRQLLDAVQVYQSAQEIETKLTKSDSANAEWQSDLAATSLWLGDALLGQGEPDEALAEFQKSLKITEKLLVDRQGRADYLFGLANVHERIGDAQLQRGQVDQAVDSYLKKLNIDLRLTLADPRNNEFQRDLLIAYVKIGDGLRKDSRGDRGTSGENYRKALDIVETMKAEGRLSPEDDWMIVDLKKRLGESMQERLLPQADTGER